MKSLWNDKEASGSEGDPLRLRVYTSRLLGREPSLVLHGGGNTSVKTTATTLFGDREDLLYIKGSGWISRRSRQRDSRRCSCRC